MAQSTTPATTATAEQHSTFQVGVAVAVALAILATMLGIFAVGRSLSIDPQPAAAVAAEGDAATSAVSVSLYEFGIDPSTVTIPASATVTVTNDGSAAHNLAVRDTDAATPDLAAGEDAVLDVSGLAPGTYEWLCTIAGHEQAGMVGELTITDGAGAVAAPAAASEEHDAGPDGGYLTKEEADKKEEVMMASMAAFPAETETHGAQVMEPTEVLEDGTKVFELVVDEVDWEVEQGKVVKAMAYNGQIPGPTIKVDLGDRYIVRVTNELDNESTTMHPHGVNGTKVQYDGVAPLTQDPIRNGESYDHVFEATEPSLGMYHSHQHALHQIPDGLAGAIIVGDYAEVTAQEGVTQEHVMMLNDAGVIGYSLNGKSFPATAPYVATQGERVMVHYMNEGVMAHPMHLHGQVGLVVAKDGYPLPEPYRMDTINVAPGERYTVVYEIEEPGTWAWHCHILSHVKKPDGAMFGMLTAMIVEEAETGSAAGGDLGTTIDPEQLPSEEDEA